MATSEGNLQNWRYRWPQWLQLSVPGQQAFPASGTGLQEGRHRGSLQVATADPPGQQGLSSAPGVSGAPRGWSMGTGYSYVEEEPPGPRGSPGHGQALKVQGRGSPEGSSLSLGDQRRQEVCPCWGVSHLTLELGNATHDPRDWRRAIPRPQLEPEPCVHGLGVDRHRRPEPPDPQDDMGTRGPRASGAFQTDPTLSPGPATPGTWDRSMARICPQASHSKTGSERRCPRVASPPGPALDDLAGVGLRCRRPGGPCPESAGSPPCPPRVQR